MRTALAPWNPCLFVLARRSLYASAPLCRRAHVYCSRARHLEPLLTKGGFGCEADIAAAYQGSGPSVLA